MAYVDRCIDATNHESKAAQFRRVRKKLIEAGKVKKNDDESYSIN
jgi:hypothetical protein